MGGQNRQTARAVPVFWLRPVPDLDTKIMSLFEELLEERFGPLAAERRPPVPVYPTPASARVIAARRAVLLGSKRAVDESVDNRAAA
jgi:hypothetical protein